MSKKWFECRCEVHGRVEADDKQKLKRLTVGTPRTRFQRNVMGCPVCFVESKTNQETVLTDKN